MEDPFVGFAPAPVSRGKLLLVDTARHSLLVDSSYRLSGIPNNDGYVDEISLVLSHQQQPVVPPEPVKLLLMGSGLMGVAAAGRRKRSG